MKKMSIYVASILIGAGAILALATPTNSYAIEDLIDSNDLGLSYGAATGLGTKDVRETIAQIIKVAMGLLGIVAVVIILIGGFTWMTAGGNEDKVAEAKKWIFSGVIGLAIILSAYALTSFVINQLVNATTTSL